MREQEGGTKVVHEVSAWVGEQNLRLGELVTEEKSNEIRAVPELLDMLDIRRDVVTEDAMSCQREIAKKLREKGAEYIRAVEENQPTLYGNIKDFFEGMESGEIREFPEDVWGSGHEKGHGGLERRAVRVVTDIGLLERKEVKSSIQYKSYRGKVGEDLEEHDQYYISSGDFCAEE